MEFIDQLISSFSDSLPGAEAQMKMAPPGRNGYFPHNSKTINAAVLLSLYKKHNQWYTVFIRRSSAQGHDRHRGQISLPGGKRDLTDPSFEYTALREANEEIGIDPNTVQIIGALSELYIPVSNFNVYPFIGHINSKPKFVRQIEEVDEVIEVPIDLLRDSTIRKQMDMPINESFVLPKVPYFDLQGEILWGATAMIISEFLELLPPK